MSIGTANSWDSNALQGIINNYADFNKTDRIKDRASDIASQRGTFVLNQDEYNDTYNREAQNQWSETWYSEYKVILALRADALQKKLNVSYSNVLDNSVYAPMKSDEEGGDYSPDSNRVLGESATGGMGGTSGSGPSSGGSVGDFETLLRAKITNNYQQTLYRAVPGGGISDGDPFDGQVPGNTLVPTPQTFRNPQYFATWRQGSYQNFTPVADGDPYDGVTIPAPLVYTNPQRYRTWTQGNWSIDASGVITHTPDAPGSWINNPAYDPGQAGGGDADNPSRIHTPDRIDDTGWELNPNYLDWAKSPDGLYASNATGYYEGAQGADPTAGEAGLPSNYIHDKHPYGDKNPYWVYRQMQIDSAVEAALDASGAYYNVSGADKSITNEDLADMIIGLVVATSYSGGTDSQGTVYPPGTTSGMIFNIDTGVTDPNAFGNLDFKISAIDGDINIAQPNWGNENWSTDSNTPAGYSKLGAIPDFDKDAEGNIQIINQSNSGVTISRAAPVNTNRNDIYTQVYCQVANTLLQPPPASLPTDVPLKTPDGIQEYLSGQLAKFGVGDYVDPATFATIADNLQAGVTTATNRGYDDFGFIGRQWDNATMPDPYFKASTLAVGTMILPGASGQSWYGKNAGGFAIPWLAGGLGYGINTPIFVAGTPMGADYPGSFLVPTNTSAILLNGIPCLPTLNLATTWFTIPIPVPSTPFTISTIIFTSFDFFGWMMEGFLNAIKKSVMKTVSTYSYATSSGIAMDSYAARGEYHFYKDGLNKMMGALGGAIPIVGSLLDVSFQALLNGVVGAGLGQADGVDIKDRLFKLNNSVQAPESRETETGGLFATTEFLKQFPIENMNYDYWMGTKQNEEVIDADMLRGVSVASNVIFNKMISMFANALPTPWSIIIGSLLPLLINLISKNIFSEYIYQDKDDSGLSLFFGKSAKWESHGFDFLEPEDGFAGDPREDNAMTRRGGWLDDIDTIMDGYSASRRYTMGVNGAQGTINNGDINEIFVDTKKVTVTELWDGQGSGTAVQSQTKYVGSDSRAFERKYNPARAINQEVFNTNFLTGTPTHYDRRDSYDLQFTTKAGESVTRTRDASLNPSFGGGIKLLNIDKNKRDDILTGTLPDDGDDQNMQYFGGDVTNVDPTKRKPNELNKILYEHLHLKGDQSNAQLVREYRDVFNMGYSKHVFLTGASYAPSGGGINSTIEIRYDPTKGRKFVDDTTNNGIYSAAGDADYIKKYSRYFKNADTGQADILLNSYFAYKKRNANAKT